MLKRRKPCPLLSTEVILQAYYQAHLFAAVFLQPIASSVPSSGAAVASALTTTMRLTVLFQESVHE